MKNREKGSILVLTVLMVAVLTALTVEFISGVYTTTSALDNWKTAQRLSFVARSGATVAAHTLSDLAGRHSYTYPGSYSIPPQNFAGDDSTILAISVDDLGGRFNVNSLVYQNGLPNQEAFKAFVRLLKLLGIDEKIADRVADWIDRDSEPRLADSEEGAKNGRLDSPAELRAIRGVSAETYERLSPYVTVHGMFRTDALTVNINTAAVPVIMSLDERITEELAQRVVTYRSLTPLAKTSDILKIAGFEGGLGQSLMGRITVKSLHFGISAVAFSRDIRRVVSTTVEVQGGAAKVLSWSEM